MAERDERGRFLPGHVGLGGRPRTVDAERIRDIVREVLDDETVERWQAAMRKKLAKGNSFASEFVRDTLGGKPAVTANVGISPELVDFMAAWNSAGQQQDVEDGEGDGNSE